MIAHFPTKYIIQLLIQHFIVQNFNSVSFFKRAFGDLFVFIIAVMIGLHKFCIRICCLVVDVIFSCLVQRVDAGKRVERLERGRNFFIASLIPAAFQPIMLNSCTILKSN